MTDRAADEAAIIDVLTRNRIAVWIGDFEAYEKCFVHADYTSRWSASYQSGVFIRTGWDDISARVKASFGDPSLRSRANAYDAKLVDVRIRISGDMAWATFDTQYPEPIEKHRINLAGRTQEARVLERHNGEWRIAFMTVFDTSIGSFNAAVIYLGGDSTVLWTSPSAMNVLETDDDLVVRAGKLRIRDRKSDEKLQTAVAWAAGLDNGIFPQRGAVPIVLEAGEGLPTKVWWVIADNGRIALSMGDAGLSGRRLDAAAVVFGLSAAQKQLAAHIADGLSLNEIAEKMAISPNTARTHLDRVYEKVGVRTQPALIRVLLSSAVPI